ncbi:MAG: restriction endonuclease [Lachnospiraceae bacterium]|nr:restriction endonuclease [Lachnospiraceae bacterium]
MAIPKYNELYGPFMRAIQDGQVHNLKEIKNAVAKELSLTNEDLSELLPSGKQTVFDNRIGWARTYLKKAGLLTSPSRAHFVISEDGRKALPDADKIDNSYLSRYSSFREFVSSEEAASVIQISDSQSGKTPEERISDAQSEIEKNLAGDLLNEVLKLEPYAFEKLVVKLLEKMGYGSNLDHPGIVTPPSNDGGIDGIIKEDRLGFSSIYIQAKKWDPTRSVDRPEVQKFAGALQGQQASKGLFITTSKFTDGAKAFVNGLYGSKIVLIDGDQLMKLMIDNDLGVSTEDVIKIKRLDSDFFSAEF